MGSFIAGVWCFEQGVCHTAAVSGGHDITQGMQPVYNFMGLCPQHDLLWTTLSGREHLRFYGTLKGLSGGSCEGGGQQLVGGVRM